MKKLAIFLSLIISLCLFSSCGQKTEYFLPDVDTLSGNEKDLYDKFVNEITGTKTEEEKKQDAIRTDYITAIARDISKKYLMTDSEDYNSLEIINKGYFKRNETESYNRIDLEADGTYVKSILINIDNNEYKLYDKYKDKIENFEYNNIGLFVQNLGPWISDDQKLENVDNTSLQRVGTSIELYREYGTNDFKIAIQTYLGFDNIANVIATPKFISDSEVEFTFADDGYGHSGSGTLKFISTENMILTINAKQDKNFGIASGTFNLIKNRM